MLESDGNFVGLIEIDGDLDDVLSPADAMPARRHSRLEAPTPASGLVERVEANLPNLKSELRAELLRFLKRLEAAS